MPGARRTKKRRITSTCPSASEDVWKSITVSYKPVSVVSSVGCLCWQVSKIKHLFSAIESMSMLAQTASCCLSPTSVCAASIGTLTMHLNAFIHHITNHACCVRLETSSAVDIVKRVSQSDRVDNSPLRQVRKRVI